MAGSPTARRRRLSIELKKLREKSALTCAQVGQALDWSGSKVNRMETGSGRVQPSDVDALCRFYDTSDELREFLKSLAREAKTRGWWQVHGAGVPEWFNIYIGLEQDASTLRQYQCEVLPGLMQTEAYARELHTTGAHMSAEDIDRAVRVRLERQDMLTRPEAPDAWFVVNEGAVRNVIGDREVMRDQLEKVLEAADLPSVTLQVLPFDSGTYPATGSFTMLGFPAPEDPDLVYRDGITDAVYLEGEHHVREYTRAFDGLRAAALSPQRSARLVQSVVKEYSK
ncbi:helix-turn-helix domain-containing protein [Streptomyces griseoincarnatus]|uniref:Helix-turn-helix domain-containing protein n=1 Tax=Streptomyces griseoincarnatus TaxID=29305 RepID=A0ABT0W010_STRGI|nr:MULTISPECIES: helix-turn-helix transcriptional regulator [Streptomyces]MBJ6616425.1 helix-turn-helix domain-containing protein [Streptomyces sp. I3(2020)]MBJ6627103.1 helix-turn-helix domain-containing protein [Streptomyces sp. I4(2020)]MBJ6632718.1 helix-turn-helix domain-containing protein [Streptomyces sp. I5]MCM2516902.1 helix-turn-helix domain-containing protein [Streptomyces griseoincarnatus]